MSSTARGEGRVRARAGFGDIVYRSIEMERVVAQARKAATRSINILIKGEFWNGQGVVRHGHSREQPGR